ncbi:MAG: L,D-transpeptidase family protein [Actinomycetia bacterium]|nr:L,D-transpeptidase family protein [Actinomycetes bacterium]
MRCLRRTATLALAGGMLVGIAAGPAAAKPDDVPVSAPTLPPEQSGSLPPEQAGPGAPPSDSGSGADPESDGKSSAPEYGTESGPGQASEPRAQSVTSNTIQVSEPNPEYGATLKATGVAAGAPAGSAVSIQMRTSGTWRPVASSTITKAGHWSLQFTAKESGSLRAMVLGTASAGIPIKVIPRVRIERHDGPALTKSKVRVNVQPRSYSAPASIIVRPKAGDRIVKTGNVSRGSLSKSLRLGFVGKAEVTVKLAAKDGLAATTATGRVKATTRVLRRGDKGPEVRPLLRELKALGFHTPQGGNKYDKTVSDVVLAFRKSQGMKRSKTMTRGTWRSLLAAEPIKPRYRKPGTHIEVNKTTQLMMVVRDGNVLGTMHVSTGRTGNTPEGSFRIFQRGGSYLYRFMAFLGNYGLHGYVPVPAYPASHGCVRQPMWAADWTWRKTRMGTEVIVYR